MRKVRKNGISWFIEEGEGIEECLDGFLPGTDVRRGYAFRECGAGGVFIKFFSERGIAGRLRNMVAPRGRKEYLLARRILDASIATPRPLGYGTGAGGSFILQERLEGQTLKDAFGRAATASELLDALARLLKRLADARIVHNDLHLDNVLLSGGRLYIIDLHKAAVRRFFGLKERVRNLAQALTMVYDRMSEAERARFFELAGQPRLRAAVEADLKAQWETWIASKKKRAFSTTSKLAVKGRRVYVRGREEDGGGTFLSLLKSDRKVRVERHSDHVRKVYRGRRRLVRAWENWAALEYVTLDVVPRPFFVQRPALFRDGYVAMEDLSGLGEELDRFLDRRYDAMSQGERRAFAAAFGAFLGGLLKRGIVQRDMKGCNLFVLKDGFRFLDVEDICFHTPSAEDVSRMLSQLATSVPARIRASDRIRFFLHLVRAFPCDAKPVFRSAASSCAGAEVVYEGVSGLKRE